MKKLISGMLIFLMLMVSNLSVFAEYNGTSNYVSNYHTSKNVIVTDEGVYINGKYYTKEEFEKLLETATELHIKPRVAIALAHPGVYVVAGVGIITLAKYGSELVVSVGGSVVNMGSWLYNSITNAFSSGKAETISKVESDYNSAKNECRPSNNRKTTNRNKNTPNKGEAYSTLDIYKDGILQIRRYFGSNGIAELDIHFAHGDGNKSHTFPHCHNWIQLSNGNWKPSSDSYPCCK